MAFRPLFALGFAALVACSSSTSTPGTSSSSSSGSVPSDPSNPGSPQPTDPPTDQPDANTLFNNQVQQITLEIDYQDGAAPFQGTVKKFGDPFGLLPMNASVIFDGKKQIKAQTTLAQMEKLTDITQTTFTRADLSNIAAAHRTEGQYSNAASFYIVFLNGTFVDDTGAAQPDLLGYTVGRTGVIAIFKPAIKDAIVEQVALIHQLGHAVGFVDDGVPVTDVNKAHVDTTDGHHCSSTGCVMGIAIERAAGAEAFAAKVSSPSAILIGQECLSDARILENTLQQ